MVDKRVSLDDLFGRYQQKMLGELHLAKAMDHPVAKGDESELNWEQMLRDYLPTRYQVLPKATFVDHTGRVSDEIDLAIVDRQYSPIVFPAASRQYVPAEAVYAAFECKQGLDREQVLYAADKVASVRILERTSASIVHAGGRIDQPKAPQHIVGGLLTTRCDWSSIDTDAFTQALRDQSEAGRLDIGCAVEAGGWRATYEHGGPKLAHTGADRSIVFFVFQLLAVLQEVGSAPALDYAKWSAFLVE